MFEVLHEYTHRGKLPASQVRVLVWKRKRMKRKRRRDYSWGGSIRISISISISISIYINGACAGIVDCAIVIVIVIAHAGIILSVCPALDKCIAKFVLDI
jgi:hypothetical protein